jgi:hypothetical protein
MLKVTKTQASKLPMWEHGSSSSITVVSFRPEGTYTINKCKDMNAADDFAEVFSMMTHYLNIDNKPWVLEWAGPSPDHPRWIETNEEQAKTALLLLMLEG